VLLTIRYFEFLSGHVGSVIPQCSPGNPNTPHPSRVLSYTNATEDLHYMLRYVGVEPRGFTEHSMKRGGATEAARYNKINDIFSFPFYVIFYVILRCGATVEEIQNAGHWACARTVEKYIEASQIRQRNFNQYFMNGPLPSNIEAPSKGDLPLNG
jgi:hypothetical protein